MKQKPMTTKQLIAKLLELDPDGNKQVSVVIPEDDYYGGWIYEENIEIDNNTVDLYCW